MITRSPYGTQARSTLPRVWRCGCAATASFGCHTLKRATSEAIAFGTSFGLDMATMLEVLNGSSGRNSATSDKFPNHVLTGRYASGFTNSLMAKDMALYLKTVEEASGPTTIGAVTVSLWEEFAAAEPNADFTRIYPFVKGS